MRFPASVLWSSLRGGRLFPAPAPPLGEPRISRGRGGRAPENTGASGLSHQPTVTYDAGGLQGKREPLRLRVVLSLRAATRCPLAILRQASGRSGGRTRRSST